MGNITMDDYVWLDEPIHKNRFKKIKWDESESIKESVKLSFDGAVMAVLRSKVEDYYREQNVAMIRHGYAKMPDKIKAEDEEGLYKLLAYYVDME